MKIISISNNKGGVGKTTTTVNVAAALQILGKKVMVIDMDHQAQSTYHFGINPTRVTESVFDVLKGEKDYREILIKRAGIDILPSNSELRNIEFIPLPAKEFLLKENMESLEGYDYVLIDCPPSLGVLTLNAMAISQYILVPLQTQFLPFHGMYNLFETVQMVKKRINRNIEVAGIIGTMFNPKKSISREVIEETEKRLPGKLFATMIRENVSLQEAPSWGKTIFEYKPDSNGADDYMTLTKEIIDRFDTLYS
jgi:chromosome partitioning protein